MPIRAVIFDLDGTLVDSLADIGEAMNLVLSERGLPTHPLSSYRSFVGDGITMLVRRALPARLRDDDDAVAACVARQKEVYGARAEHLTRPYDGIADLLDALSTREIPMAVLSNKPHELTVGLVDALLGAWNFEPIFGERAAVPRKPDPAAALEIADRLGVAPRDILYVGDTPTDMATAEAAGMPALGAAWGFRSEDELRRAGATRIAHHPTDVLGFLDV